MFAAVKCVIDIVCLPLDCCFQGYYIYLAWLSPFNCPFDSVNSFLGLLFPVFLMPFICCTNIDLCSLFTVCVPSFQTAHMFDHLMSINTFGFMFLFL